MKIIIAILVVLLVLLQYQIWVGDGGMPDVLRLQHELEQAEMKNRALEERNSALNAEVKDLKKGLEAIEERARSELGMVGEDETFFQVIKPDGN